MTTSNHNTLTSPSAQAAASSCVGSAEKRNTLAAHGAYGVSSHEENASATTIHGVSFGVRSDAHSGFVPERSGKISAGLTTTSVVKVKARACPSGNR